MSVVKSTKSNVFSVVEGIINDGAVVGIKKESKDSVVSGNKPWKNSPVVSMLRMSNQLWVVVSRKRSMFSVKSGLGFSVGDCRFSLETVLLLDDTVTSEKKAFISDSIRWKKKLILFSIFFFIWLSLGLRVRCWCWAKMRAIMGGGWFNRSRTELVEEHLAAHNHVKAHSAF